MQLLKTKCGFFSLMCETMEQVITLCISNIADYLKPSNPYSQGGVLQTQKMMWISFVSALTSFESERNEGKGTGQTGWDRNPTPLFSRFLPYSMFLRAILPLSSLLRQIISSCIHIPCPFQLFSVQSGVLRLCSF